MKNNNKTRKIVAVRGRALIINQIDRIDGPTQVYIEPSSIAICITGHLKLYKYARCITPEETETMREKLLVDNYSILLTITEEGEYEIDLQDSFDLFVQYTLDEFETLAEEDWLLFEFGLVQTKTVRSQLDIYKNLSFDTLIEEFTILAKDSTTPDEVLFAISEIVCRTSSTISRVYALQENKEILKFLLKDIEYMGDNIAINSYISDMILSINDRLQEIVDSKKSEKQRLQEKIAALVEKEKNAAENGEYKEAAKCRDEIKLLKGTVIKINKNQ